MTVSWKHIAVGLGVAIFDLTIYVLLGLLLMNYDDFYNESKGKYWSLDSMTLADKITFVGLNAWHAVNVLGIVYILYRLIKKIKKHRWQYRLRNQSHHE